MASEDKTKTTYKQTKSKNKPLKVSDLLTQTLPLPSGQLSGIDYFTEDIEILTSCVQTNLKLFFRILLILVSCHIAAFLVRSIDVEAASRHIIDV